MQVTLPMHIPAHSKNIFITTSAALLLFAASSSAQVVRQISPSRNLSARVHASGNARNTRPRNTSPGSGYRA